MLRSTTSLALVCAVVTSCAVPLRSANAQWIEAQMQPNPPQHWAPAPNWMPMPEMRPLEFPQLQPPPTIVYPPVRGPQACETVCRPTRDGGSRCTNVCYGG